MVFAFSHQYETLHTRLVQQEVVNHSNLNYSLFVDKWDQVHCRVKS